MAIDTEAFPELPEPVRKDYATLTHNRKQALHAGELVRRRALMEALCASVHLAVPDDRAARDQVAEKFVPIMVEAAESACEKVVAAESRHVVLAKRDKGYTADCWVAAAGGLFGLSDKRLRERLAQIKAEYAYRRQRTRIEEQGRGLKEVWLVGAAAWLYGVLDDSNELLSPKTPWRYQAELFAAFHMRVIERLKDNSAALVADLQEPLGANTGKEQYAEPPSDEEQTAANPKLHYIHRKRPEAQFWEAVNAGAKRIVFHGQAGMGKTALAKRLTRDVVTRDPAPIIEVNQGRVAAKDIESVCAAYGFSAQTPQSADPLVQLSSFLCSPLAPPFFVLDNLDSSDELRKLLPPTTKSTVVATCRRKGDIPLDASYIRVDKMTRDEASQLIKTYIADVTDVDARHVALVFGDYPLVLSYLAATCRNLRMGIRDFCQEGSTDFITVAEGVRTEEGQALLTVLRFMMSAIAERDPLALDILVYSSFKFHYNFRPAFWYLPFFVRYLNGSSPGNVTRLRVIQAFQVLHDFALLVADDSRSWEDACLHPFTAAILSEEFSNKLPEVVERIRALDVGSYDDADQILAAVRSGRPGSIILASESGGGPLIMRYSTAHGYHMVEYMPILFHVGFLGLQIRPDRYSKSPAEPAESASASSTTEHYDTVEMDIERTLSLLSNSRLAQESKQIIRNVYYEIKRMLP